ncbi:MAG: Histidine kinase [Bacteroidota bacterium]|nr:Histidine kinase [Bacteroidota bacterium]
MKVAIKKKTPWRRSIFFRTAFYSWILIFMTLMIYVIATLPYQQNIITERMKSEAKDIATSIGQVTSTAIITEDYSFAVEHCMKVVTESHSILYVVITKKDGFSLIHTAKLWRQDNLSGIWTPKQEEINQNMFVNSDIVNKEVFQFTHLFSYSGIDWGWIHIGLSLDKFNSDVNNIYRRTFILAIICIIIGFVGSMYFTLKLIRPIKILDKVTQDVAGGDLNARVYLSTGDELENLSLSFNKMTEALQNSQNDLINSREYIHNIIESLNDTIIVINTKGIINSVNSSTLKLLKYSAVELINLNINKVIRDWQNQLFFNEFIFLLEKNGFLTNLEIYYFSKEGNSIPILFSASGMYNEENKLTGIVCVGLDITERKIAEEALKNSEARYRGIVEDQTELLARFLPEGRLTFVNEAFCKYFHLKREELIDSIFFPPMPDEDFKIVADAYKSINIDNPVVNYEFRVIDEDNTLKWLSWTNRAIFDGDGKILEYQSTGRDITEKKLVEEEIRNLNISLEGRVAERTAQLESSLKEKEVMLKEIHHRVKNNLQVISSLLSLQSSTIKDKKGFDIFQESQNRVKSMAMIHEKLYNSKDLAKIDFNDYLNDLTRSLLRSYGLNTNINLQLDIENMYLDIDVSVHCGLIINELVSNSLKYGFPDKNNGNIFVNLKKVNGNFINLVIGDDGVGLPENIDFRNTQSLGLRLVNILVKQLKGDINLVSKNNGVVFEINFMENYKG